jgi:hypothetical protein
VVLRACCKKNHITSTSHLLQPTTPSTKSRQKRSATPPSSPSSQPSFLPARLTQPSSHPPSLPPPESPPSSPPTLPPSHIPRLRHPHPSLRASRLPQLPAKRRSVRSSLRSRCLYQRAADRGRAGQMMQIQFEFEKPVQTRFCAYCYCQGGFADGSDKRE